MPSIDLQQYKTSKAKKAKIDGEKFSLLELLNKDITLGGEGLSDKKKESLYVELSSLLMAGIDLKTSFELVTSGQEKEKDKILFEKIQEVVIQGVPFSKALEQSGKFSRYEVYSLQIGEETGKLTEVMLDLAKFYKNKIKQRRKIIAALTYPCVVLLTSFGAVFFMLKFVVPMFSDIFKRFGGELPWLTQKIVSLSQFLQDYTIAFLIACVTIIAAIWYARETAWFRKNVSLIVLRIPIMGNMVQKIYLARFCNSMRLLINARLPLLNAISLSRQMIGYYPIEASLQQVEDDIMSGKALHQTLKQFSIYPAKMIQLLKIGEESNKLDYFFEKISEQYIEEVEYRTSTLSSTMEPIIILFLGLIVGTILVALYLPMFEMSNSFQ